MRIVLLLAASAGIIAAVFAYQSQVEGRLLRADPNAIPSNASLMAFAHGRGAAWYDAACANCHGTNGKGDPMRGIPDLTDGDWLYGTGSVSDIEQVIKYGIRSYHPKAWNLASMPAYARSRPSARDPKIPSLSPANIRDVVEFLLYQQGQNSAPTSAAVDTASAGRGAAIYSDVGGCYDCHAADAKGDAAIGAPNLTDRVTLYGDGGRESLAVSIEYGRAGVCPAWDMRIGAAAIRELALYVHTWQ